MYLI
ncbi:uncharacterized protein FFE2_09510 [Fusarium fujikuroi]|jgi:hypothetical protein